VIATNKDDINTFTVSVGGGYVGVGISAGVNVISTTTNAYIGSDAVVNQDTSSAAASQSVLVAAGSDFKHMAVAGTVGVGAVGVAPAVGVTVLSMTTAATIGAGATVNAKSEVLVQAHAREDVLVAGFGILEGGDELHETIRRAGIPHLVEEGIL
jgi:hypothetical protein